MNRNYERFANDILTLDGLLGKHPIGVEYQFDCFDEVCPRLLETGALRIGARQLLDEANITLGNLAVDSG